MFQVFRSAHRRNEDEEIGEATRRNDAAHEALKHALRRLLAERNVAGAAKGFAR